MAAGPDGFNTGRHGLPDELMRSAYAQLRELASLYLAGRRGTALQATSLVHEAFVRLAKNERQEWESETHFAAVAATVMRRVLVDEIRARNRLCRGGGWVRIDLNDLANGVHAGGTTAGSAPHEESVLELLALDEALTELAKLSERQARIVELRYFGGLSVAQTAEALGVSTRTVESDWTIARAWLKRRMEGRP